MGFLTFSIKDAFSASLSQKIQEAGPKAAHAVAIQIQKDTEPFVPALTKSLANHTQVNGDTVIYPGPYARYLYYGKLMIDPTTGSSWAPYGATKVVTGQKLNISQAVHHKAQSLWYEVSKAQNKQKWIRVAERAVTSELNK